MDPLYQFLNRVRTLYCIDAHELEAAGLALSADQWRAFRTNPTGFLVQADDETARKVWSIIEAREARRAARAA